MRFAVFKDVKIFPGGLIKDQIAIPPDKFTLSTGKRAPCLWAWSDQAYYFELSCTFEEALAELDMALLSPRQPTSPGPTFCDEVLKEVFGKKGDD